MEEALFNTLAAVALMCSGHAQSLNDTKWEAGFEQCAVVVKRLDEEKARRAVEKASLKTAQERERLANALKGLSGRQFTPEDAPKLVTGTPWSSCYSIVPTDNAHPL